MWGDVTRLNPITVKWSSYAQAVQTSLLRYVDWTCYYP
ncbi:MAG: hypothetical protein ACLT67_06870 [Streptococcus salivarius]